jgi:Spy/CpxP family protein refolding chaperone
VRHVLVAIVGLTFVLGGTTEAVGQAPAAVPIDRAAAQDLIRERVVRLLRERVGLTDDQMRRLAPVSRSFEARRQTIFREERTTRQALRRELTVESADQARVAAHIDQLFALQRRRLDLAAEEQRELAAFMTPVQRARYLALQEHLRRRADEMRRRRGGRPPGGGGRRGPGDGPPRF